MDGISAYSWIDLFALAGSLPVIWESRNDLVAWMAENPEHEVVTYVHDIGFGQTPDGWRDRVSGLVANRQPDHPDGSTEQRFRYLLGLAMSELRGRVPATEVAAAIRTEMGANDD